MLEFVMIMWIYHTGLGINVAYFSTMELCNAAKNTMEVQSKKYASAYFGCFPTGKK